MRWCDRYRREGTRGMFDSKTALADKTENVTTNGGIARKYLRVVLTKARKNLAVAPGFRIRRRRLHISREAHHNSMLAIRRSRVGKTIENDQYVASYPGSITNKVALSTAEPPLSSKHITEMQEQHTYATYVMKCGIKSIE